MCPEFNTDYNGNDIIYFEDAEVTGSWQMCGGKCKDEPACTHWTWFNQNYPDEILQGKCLLKTGRENVAEVNWGISGDKYCPEVSVSGIY